MITRGYIEFKINVDIIALPKHQSKPGKNLAAVLSKSLTLFICIRRLPARMLANFRFPPHMPEYSCMDHAKLMSTACSSNQPEQLVQFGRLSSSGSAWSYSEPVSFNLVMNGALIPSVLLCRYHGLSGRGGG